jgi:tetratricopeptide (TPR) repeat protein
LRDRMGTARLQVDRLLIVVDQAEELFSQPWRLTDAASIARFHADTEQFIRLLLEAAAQGPASVVLTIRSDFFDPLMHSPFAPLLNDALVQLGRIADLHPSIERPAALVGLRFAPGLVDRMVEEVGAEESNLPLLQHALERTWQRRAGPVLSANVYDAAGGVAQAINQAARDCYESLSPGERDAARRLFLRLVRPGEGTAHVRIRAAVPDDADERHVMEVFAHPDRRLLFVGEQAGVPVVEVAHEALVRGWDTLRGWVEDSRERLRVRDAVTDWRGSAAANELIPNGSTLLQRARELLADPGDVRLDRGLQAYVEHSIAAADAAERWRRWVFAAAVVAAFGFAGLSAASGWFWYQSEKQRAIADEQRAIANEQRGIADEQRDIADELRDIAEDARTHAENSAEAAIGAAKSLIVDLAQNLDDQQDISVRTTNQILTTALHVIETMLRADPHDPALLRMEMGALFEFAEFDARIHQTAEQLKLANQAHDIAQSLAEAAPIDNERQSDLSRSDQLVAEALMARGNLPEALKSFRDGLGIADRLARADPGNAEWQHDLSESYNNVGDVLAAQGNLPEALKNYGDGLAIRDSVARGDPGNIKWQRDLLVSHDKLGDVLVAQGHLPEALKSYQDGLAIAHRLAGAEPGNAGRQRDLSVSYSAIGEALVAQGNLPEALKSYRDSLAISDHLAHADPGNAGWQRDLSVAYNKVGDVLVAQGNLPEALKNYRDSLAIRDRVARVDPANALWQQYLSASYNNVGKVLVAQGNLPEALNSYRDSLAIRDRLARADAGNAEWQRALSASYENVGDVLVEQHNLTEALKSYQDGLAIADRLARADPGNANWQRELVDSLGRVAVTLLEQGQQAEARPLAERALTELRSAIARTPDDPRLTRDLPYYQDLLRYAGGTP